MHLLEPVAVYISKSEFNFPPQRTPLLPNCVSPTGLTAWTGLGL